MIFLTDNYLLLALTSTCSVEAHTQASLDVPMRYHDVVNRRPHKQGSKGHTRSGVINLHRAVTNKAVYSFLYFPIKLATCEKVTQRPKHILYGMLLISSNFLFRRPQQSWTRFSVRRALVRSIQRLGLSPPTGILVVILAMAFRLGNSQP